MEVQLLPSAFGASGQNLSSYLVNGVVAIDGGSIGFFGNAADQAKIRHVFLTHSHLDHVASLPVFLDNVYGVAADPVVVHGSAFVLDSLQHDVFNDRLWPDFIALSKALPPFLRLQATEEGVPAEVCGLRVRPVSVDHPVPTSAYIIESEDAACAVITDTCPTEEIWRAAARTPNLRLIFLEATFPRRLSALAKVSKHLTTELFRREIEKAPAGVRIVPVHMKTQFYDEVVAELREMELPNVVLRRPGDVFFV